MGKMRGAGNGRKAQGVRGRGEYLVDRVSQIRGKIQYSVNSTQDTGNGAQTR